MKRRRKKNNKRRRRKKRNKKRKTIISQHKVKLYVSSYCYCYYCNLKHYLININLQEKANKIRCMFVESQGFWDIAFPIINNKK